MYKKELLIRSLYPLSIFTAIYKKKLQKKMIGKKPAERYMYSVMLHFDDKKVIGTKNNDRRKGVLVDLINLGLIIES